MSDALDWAGLPGWRWLDGARWVLPGTGLSGRYRGILLDPEAVPDTSDPATLGCILALVREAWGHGAIWVGRTVDGWRVFHHVGGLPRALRDAEGQTIDGPTEAHALYAALAAADHNRRPMEAHDADR